MTENEREAKIKELQAHTEQANREHTELKVEYDKLYKDYVTVKGDLQDEKRLNERYLRIIENLTQGE